MSEHTKASILILFLFINCYIFAGCNPASDLLDKVSDDESTYVAVGDSLTAGVQSDGIEDNFQEVSFPNLIAKQLGINDFEQPLVDSPGIGFNKVGTTPLMYKNGMIFREETDIDPFDLLDNLLLDRPYDNLGLPGAELVDVQSTSMLLFEAILRGMGSQLEQATRLNPDLLTLWIGNNDVLGVANGGDVEDITPIDKFSADYRNLLEQLTNNTHALIVAANIPNVTDIPLINFYDDIFRTVPQLGINTPVPVLYDPATFQPIDFGEGLFIPMLTQETGVEHVLIDILLDDSTYLYDGVGIPDKQTLEVMGLTSMEATDIISQIQSMGLIPSGIAIDKDSTLTVTEQEIIEDAVLNINNVISNLAGEFDIPVVDINSLLFELNNSGIDGFTGEFVLKDPENTAFSLDGIHANNAGYAIIANSFIKVINKQFAMNIPLVNPEQYRGQYIN